ncbi:hypothetical protein MRX96_040732 [Rhipicephalus microplus]
MPVSPRSTADKARLRICQRGHPRELWPFPPIVDSPRFLVWQPQATISAADLSARLQKPSSLRSQLGHATAASMAFKLSFLMQVLLSWSANLPLNLVNAEACPFRLVPQPTRPVFESVNADTRENFWPFPPIVDSPRYLGNYGLLEYMHVLGYVFAADGKRL